MLTNFYFIFSIRIEEKKLKWTALNILIDSILKKIFQYLAGIKAHSNGSGKTLVNYTYVASGNGLGQLQKAEVPSGPSDAYTYDSYGRVLTATKHIDGTTSDIVFQNHYDSKGNMDQVTYPGNYTIQNQYDGYGNLTSVLNGTNPIWTLNTLTATQMNYSLGSGSNGLATTKTYDAYGSLQSIVTTKGSTQVQSLLYDFNAVNGVLNSREDKILKLREEFHYDDLYRLTDWNIRNTTTNILTATNNLGYKTDQSGNIDTKPGIGTYAYQGGPHQLYSVTPTGTSAISTNDQFLYYNTDINKVSAITENNYELDLTYGHDAERVKTVLSQNSTVNYTKYFGGLYEKKVINGGNTLEYYYIPAGDGLAAVLIKTNGNAGTLYYLQKDHLGSIIALTDANGSIAEQYNYDPWGRRRNPADWTQFDTRTSFLLDRGFTGHEHITELNLINMNGRFYDPLLGMFISPDNYVQSPSNSQNFNRYTYCINNPLKYTDPSGEAFGIDDAIMIAIIAYSAYEGGVATNHGQMNPTKWNWNNASTYTGIIGGGLVGWATFGIGSAMYNAGVPMTLNLMYTSTYSSIAMNAVTGGNTPVSMSFGIGSYNWTTGEWGYLGKKGNSVMENIGYTFGAMANLQDLVTWDAGEIIDYKDKKSLMGHAELEDGDGDRISKAYQYEGDTRKYGFLWGKGRPYDEQVGDEWFRMPLRVNKNIYDWMYGNLDEGHDIFGMGQLRYALVGNSCISQASRALWALGIPNLGGVWPHLLTLQLAIRQVGIYASPYLEQMP